MRSRPTVLVALTLAAVGLGACTSSSSPSAKQSAQAASSLAAQQHPTEVGAATPGKRTDSRSSSLPPQGTQAHSSPPPKGTQAHSSTSPGATHRVGVPISYTLVGTTATMTVEKVTMHAKPSVGRVPPGKQDIVLRVKIVVTRGVVAKDGTGGYDANANLGDSLQLGDGTTLDQTSGLGFDTKFMAQAALKTGQTVSGDLPFEAPQGATAAALQVVSGPHGNDRLTITLR